VDWSTIETVIGRAWGPQVHESAVVEIGLNSRVWAVRTDAGRALVKLVSDRDPFTAGLQIAEQLATHVRSGPPMRTRSGQLTVETNHGWLAMLRRESGRPLRLSDETDRRRWGARLGDVHRRLADVVVSEPLPRWPWDWLDIDADHLRADLALRASIARAREAAEGYVDRCRPEIAVLHGDPNPQEFLLDAWGDVAVIDWGAVQHGPLLYDVASARRFAGSDRRFRVALDGYVASMGSGGSPAGLRVFLRYREAVQAWYFSHRVASNDTTGATSAFNLAGLHNARAALEYLDSN
jgi:homoserine kinase type II